MRSRLAVESGARRDVFPRFRLQLLTGPPYSTSILLSASSSWLPALLFWRYALAWRLISALFGCALLVLGAVLGCCYTKERVGALLLAAFVASETVLVVYSRTDLLDGILLFFILATLLTALRAEWRGQVIWPTVLFGLFRRRQMGGATYELRSLAQGAAQPLRGRIVDLGRRLRSRSLGGRSRTGPETRSWCG